MTAKEYFQRLDDLNLMIDAKARLSASLKDSLSIAAPPPDADQVSHTRNVHAMQDRIAAILDLERETDALVDELVELKNQMVEAISQLSDSKEAIFLSERFIAGKSTSTIAAENHYTQRWVQQIIKVGTDHVDVILEKTSP